MGERTIRQPGPAAAVRCLAVPAAGFPMRATLPAGTRLLDALHALLGNGLHAAALRLTGGAFAPFAYVMPAASPDAEHAAYYSLPLRPPGEARLDAGAVTVGFRDDQPFFHCHAIWTEADGRRGCGHVLPEETVIAAPVAIEGLGIAGARFAVRPDEETGFSLFVPTPATPLAERRNALALRLAPNQDLAAALVRAAKAAGFARARLAGGVGSTIGARFVDTAPLTGFATELFVRHGVIDGDACALDVTIVDLDGAVREGRLVAGDNPVLMTFEGVLEAF